MRFLVILPSVSPRWFVIKAQGEPGHGSKLYDGSAMGRLQARGHADTRTRKRISADRRGNSFAFPVSCDFQWCCGVCCCVRRTTGGDGEGVRLPRERAQQDEGAPRRSTTQRRRVVWPVFSPVAGPPRHLSPTPSTHAVLTLFKRHPPHLPLLLLSVLFAFTAGRRCPRRGCVNQPGAPKATTMNSAAHLFSTFSALRCTRL